MLSTDIHQNIDKKDLFQDDDGKYWILPPHWNDLDTNKPTFPSLECQNGNAITFYKKNCLGNGTFGQVYLGQNQDTGELCAVKAHYCGSETELDEAAKEQEALLKHNKLIDIFFSAEDDRFYIVQSLAKGNNLKSFISPKTSLLDRLEIAEGVIKAVLKFYNKGFLHRDLKLENIMWDPINKEATLVDLAKSVDVRELPNRLYQDQSDGTMQYMAPEICAGRHAKVNYSQKSEIYALGIIVLEILSGQLFDDNKISPKTLFVHYDELRDKNLIHTHKGIAPQVKEAFHGFFKEAADPLKNLVTKMVQMNPDLRFSPELLLQMLKNIKANISKAIPDKKNTRPGSALVFSQKTGRSSKDSKKYSTLEKVHQEKREALNFSY